MTAPTERYLSSLREGIADIAFDLQTITDAAARLARCIAEDGIVHVFGSGHSAMLAQEVFHRAGGLVPFNAMLDINLTILGTAHPTLLERMEGYGPAVFTNYDVRPGDVVIVISTSGVNPVPIEVAEIARDRGAYVVAVTSASSYRDMPSRHSGNRRLGDVADTVLDTHVPLGDATVPIGQTGVTVGATSTILGAILLNLLVVETARILDEEGHPVPAFVSQNIPGGDQHNAALIDRYARRLPLMKP